MAIRLTSLRHHRWLASLALLAFVLRALIPAGFMPGGQGTLTLQICPDGFAAALPASPGAVGHAQHHHHYATASELADSATGGAPSDPPSHDHRSWKSGHCVFSAVAGAPPLAHSLIGAKLSESAAPSAPTVAAAVSLDTRFRIAQPRAPPVLV